MANASQTVQRQARMQRMVDAHVARGGGVIQRALYANPNYAPNAATLPHFQALDGQVGTASTNARAAVTATGGPADTPKQVNWKVHPNATTWGYVVEEQFDGIATGLGWSTQAVIPSGRPDYKKTVGGVTLFADLTTLGQSGAGGPHIGGKLAVAYAALAAKGAAPAWHAADIVHDGAQPGQAPAAIAPNGTVSAAHDQAFTRFKAAVQEDNYDPWVDHMTRYYSPLLSHGTFYAEFTKAQRDTFVKRANAKVD